MQRCRCRARATLAPTALTTSPAITCEPIDSKTAAATITDCGLTARHVFHFDDEGRVIRSESNDRYELYPGEGYKATGLVMRRLDDREVEGYPIPLREEVIRIENGREVLFFEETFSEIELHH